MNEHILHKDVQDFINKNVKSDLTKLILKGSPFEHVSIQEIAQQIVGKQKSEKKLPSWYSQPEMYYPPKINLEQTSSEITANYKADLVSGDSIIDITGGFGVDCHAFSKRFKSVTHCEINTELSRIAAHNFQKLGAKNVLSTSQNGIEYLNTSENTFSWIYADPSRRDDYKGKVFLLEDCAPNIPEHLDLLFSKSSSILLKVSPILDITSTIRELKSIKEVHVIAVNNEVKELAFILKKDFEGPINIHTTNHVKSDKQEFHFTYGESGESNYSMPQNFLYEPNAAILKSGAFHQLSRAFETNKLHEHSHLYTSEDLKAFPGRRFKIEKVINYSSKKIHKDIALKKANITVRNFPKSVAQIRQETKLKDGGSYYLFFTTNQQNQLIVIQCTKI